MLKGEITWCNDQANVEDKSVDKHVMNKLLYDYAETERLPAVPEGRGGGGRYSLKSTIRDGSA